MSVEDDECSGWPRTSKTTDNVEKNSRTRQWRLSPNNPWAHRHCWDHLRSLPGDLNRKFEHASHCHEVCSPTICKWSKAVVRSKAPVSKRVLSYERGLTRTKITGDKNWIYVYDPETKQQSSQWKRPQSPRAKKARQVWSSTKSMLIVFSTGRGPFTVNLFLLTLRSTLPFTVMFWDAWEKMCDEKDRNFGATTTGYFIMTMHPPTRPWKPQSV
jgi:hypothetical protein